MNNKQLQNYPIGFQPVRGLESNIMSMGYNEGYVYFATDTKKIYVDAQGAAKVPMGGNSGIYYGTKKFEELPDDGQIEFEFTLNDIEGNLNAPQPIIPNPNDLILNIPDGCFYRVISILELNGETLIQVHKLTIAGSGSGGGGVALGKASLEVVGKQVFTILKNSDCSISFKAHGEYADGSLSTGMVADLVVNGIPQRKRFAISEGLNTVKIGEFLDQESNSVRIIAYVDIGGITETKVAKTWSITSATSKLIWDYKDTKINSLNEPFNFQWSVTGNASIKKTTYITIDDVYNLDPIVSYSISNQEYKFNPSVNSDFTLTHGAHKINMRATVDIEEEVIEVGSITYNIIFIDPENEQTIISCPWFESKISQYDTIQVPIIIYNKNNTNGTAQIILRHGAKTVDTWKDCANATKYFWAFTPTEPGHQSLTIQSGLSEKVISVEVTPLNINNKEVPGYAFKFKASDFPSNSAIKDWSKTSGIPLTFSKGFDWVNGGLKNDEFGNSAVCVKAGSSIEFGYKLFKKQITETTGKTIKFIFKTDKCRDYEGQILECLESDGSEEKNRGLKLTANTGYFYSAGTHFAIPYCEDTYIELEIDITPKYSGKTCYITGWLDGVPCIVKTWTQPEDFLQMVPKNITIGSSECDVYLYMIKVYEKHLDTNERIANFIADAPNAIEMVKRYKRNDILDDSGEISPTKLAKANPDLKVHVYEIPRMTQNKKDNVRECTYRQYKGSEEPQVSSTDVLMKVQGTSSAAYGVAAFNFDCDFSAGGFTYADGSHTAGMKMTPSSKPVNYFCTKVNVASSEGTNNAINQAWYNDNQPFLSKKRQKDPTARDCMFFEPGVVFMKDNNKDPIANECDNLFKEIPGYIENPYFKMYAIGCMGNSKKNVEVFHDTENPRECCVEVNDNQQAQQWMTNDMFPQDELYNKDRQKYFEFRYPDDGDFAEFATSGKPGERTRFDLTLAGWRRFVSWMAHNNPQPLYEPISLESQKEYDDAKYRSVEAKTEKQFEQYLEITKDTEGHETIKGEIFIKTEDGQYKSVTAFQPGITTYYLQRSCGYKKAWIYNQEDFEIYKEPIYIINNGAEIEVHSYQEGIEKSADKFIDQLNQEAGIIGPEEHTPTNFYLKRQGIYQKIAGYYEPVLAYSPEISEYYIVAENMYGYSDEPFKPKEVEKDLEHKYEYSFKEPYNFKGFQSEEPVVKGCLINAYTDENGNNGHPYSIDNKNYRMAKMMSECENYMVMDSVIYHFLFIERHTMIDNVAKNTFWSSSDLIHWDLTKNYDDDTADGNDNSGKLTLTYGIETTDKNDVNLSYFNASNSVWLNFCQGLYPLCKQVYQRLQASKKSKDVWNSTLYLRKHDKWQAAIPERCWIEDYYRKYIRPKEIYGQASYLDMLEGGQKKHQRKQYEIYQENYIDTKYYGNKTSSDYIHSKIHNSGIPSFKNYTFPVKVYSDCYIQAAFGSGTDPNVVIRAKRKNNPIMITLPITEYSDATANLYAGYNYTAIGNIDAPPGKEHYGDLLPSTLEINTATRLRELDLTTSDLPLPNGGRLANISETRVNVTSPMLERLAATGYKGLDSELNLSTATELKYLDTRRSNFKSITLAPGAPVETLYLEAPGTLELNSLYKVKNFSIANYDNLATLKLKDIDKNIVDGVNVLSSKELAKKSLSHLISYTLLDVDWKIDNPEELSGETIPLLDALAAKVEDQEIRKTLLTGKVLVTSKAYSGNSAINIYNKYAKPNMFPELDLQFEASPKLQKITVLNGDGIVHWKRKIITGQTFYSEFFTDGPLGAFKSEIRKSPSESHIFTFNKQWEVYEDKGQDIDPIFLETVNCSLNNIPDYSKQIDKDLIFKPVFNQEVRHFTIQFYATGDAAEPMGPPISCPYGSKLKDNLPTQIPYKPYDGENLYTAYDFLGYGLTKDATIPVSEEYPIAQGTPEEPFKFYGVFRLVSDIREIVHPEWFNYYKNYTYTTRNWVTGSVSDEKIRGTAISPKKELQLKGKIVLPAKDPDGTPVISVNGFGSYYDGDSPSQPGITHIFVQKENNLVEINNNAFSDLTKLQYFDFINAHIKAIGTRAFKGCPLNDDSTNLGTDLIYVGSLAFNQAFRTNRPVTLILSSKIEELGGNAFTYMRLKRGSKIIIGSNGNPAPLDLSKPNTSSGYELKIEMNQEFELQGIDFYSTLYSQSEDSIGGGFTVSDCFREYVGTISIQKQ